MYVRTYVLMYVCMYMYVYVYERGREGKKEGGRTMYYLEMSHVAFPTYYAYTKYCFFIRSGYLATVDQIADPYPSITPTPQLLPLISQYKKLLDGARAIHLFIKEPAGDFDVE